MNYRRILWSSFTVIGLGMLVAPLILSPAPRLLYNPSSSAPIGWYRVSVAQQYDRGDLVASWLPDNAERLADQRNYLPRGTPVIKTIWAVPGDEICWQEGRVSFLEQPSLRISRFDRNGRSLEHPADGCITLNSKQYFLASNRIESSFDSRYFGPVDQDHLIGTAEFLGSYILGKRRQGRNRHRARAKGAEGKIKGNSAVRCLLPCLHIIFHGSVEEFAALRIGKIVSIINGVERRCHPTLHSSTQPPDHA